jgi:uncharacterized protein YndB with AHSA1/START domain
LINRQPDEVFSYLSDVTNMPSWQPYVDKVVRTSDGQIGLGSTFRVKGRNYAARSRISRFDPPRSLAVSVAFEYGRGEIAFELEPVDGGTRVHGTVTVKLTGIASAFANRPDVLRRGEEEIEASLRNIKNQLG